MQSAKKLNGTNISVDKEFSQETIEYRKELWKEVKQLRREVKIAYLNYRIVVRRERNQPRPQRICSGDEVGEERQS